MSLVAMRGALLLAAFTSQLPRLGYSVLYPVQSQRSSLPEQRNNNEVKVKVKPEAPEMVADDDAMVPLKRHHEMATKIKDKHSPVSEEALLAQSPPVSAPEFGAERSVTAPKTPNSLLDCSVEYDVAWSWQMMESVGEPKAQSQARLDAFQREVFSSFDTVVAEAVGADEITRAQEFLAMSKYVAKANNSTRSSGRANVAPPARGEEAAPPEVGAAMASAQPEGQSFAAAARAAERAAAIAAKAAAVVAAAKAATSTTFQVLQYAPNAKKSLAAAVVSEPPTDAQKLASEIIEGEENSDALSDAQTIAVEMMEQERARWHNVQSQKLILQRDVADTNQSLQEVKTALANLNVSQMLTSVRPVMDAIQKSLKQGEAVVLAYKFMNGPNNEAVRDWFTGLSSKMNVTMKQFNDSVAAAALKSGRNVVAITNQLVQAGDLALTAYQTSMDLIEDVLENRGVTAEMLALQLQIPGVGGVVVAPHNKDLKGNNNGNEDIARSHLLKRAGNAAYFQVSSMPGMDLDHSFYKKGSESDCGKAKDSMLSAESTLAAFEEMIGSVSTLLHTSFSLLVQAATDSAASVNSELIPFLNVAFLNNPSSSSLSSALHSSFAALVDFRAQLNSTIEAAVASVGSALNKSLLLLLPVREVSAQLLSSLETTCSINPMQHSISGSTP